MIRHLLLITIISLFANVDMLAQSTSVLDHFPKLNISNSNDPSPGYFFIATKKIADENGSNYMAIFDNYGTPVYMKLLNDKGSGIRVKDGKLFLIDGTNGKAYFELDNKFNPIDTFSTEGYSQDGHDFDIDENGNYLLLASENISVDMSLLVEGGDPNATIKDKLVQEFDADKNLLYTWKSWEHFEVTDADTTSPLVDLTKSSVDYNHANAICFDSDTSFLLSVRHFNEITKIDRRTGNIIWRFGGKKNDFEFVNDTIGFSHQHSIRKLANGNIMFFDNGNMRVPQQTSVVEYALDELNKKATLIKRYEHNPLIYTDHAGGQQYTNNGNILIYWGEESPSLTEYHPDGTKAIEIDFSNHSFSNRIAKAEWKHEVFVTNTQEIDYGMWDGYTESPFNLILHNNTDSVITITDYSTRTPHFKIEETLPLELPANGDLPLTVIYYPETAQQGFVKDVLTINSTTDTLHIAQQVSLFGSLEDNDAPEVIMTPNSSQVPLTASVNVSFNEPVRFINGTELNYSNIDDLFTFRKDNLNGEDVPYNANINSEKTHIEIIPSDSLEMNQLYFVSLNAVLEDFSGNVITHTETTFNTGSLTDIKTIAPLAEINILPNPSTGAFAFKMKEGLVYSIEIYSILGNLIYKEEDVHESYKSLNITEHEPGIYLLVIKSKNKDVIASQKIIIYAH